MSLVSLPACPGLGASFQTALSPWARLTAQLAWFREHSCFSPPLPCLAPHPLCACGGFIINASAWVGHLIPHMASGQGFLGKEMLKTAWKRQ